MIASEEIIKRMAAQKADGGTSPFNQRIFVELLRGNQVAHHIAGVVGELRKHRDVMAAALRRFIPEANVCVPEGGYYLWARLPAIVDADVLAGLALDQGVKIYSGRSAILSSPKKTRCDSASPTRSQRASRRGSNAWPESTTVFVTVGEDARNTAVAAALNRSSY